MIPKIIHYSWFSGDPYPEWIEKCINTWKGKLEGYEFILWDMARLEEEIDAPFVKEAISKRKWAFAADYTRLYAIYKYGGIWFDTDVELFKSLDDVLDCEMFIGKESWPDENREVYLTSHCMGAIPAHPFIKECLDYYKDRHFILKNEDGSESFDETTISFMQSEKALKYGLDRNEFHKDRPQILSNGVKVYPSYCFCRPMYTSMKKVYCIHRCAGGWRNKDIDGRDMTDPKKMTVKIWLHSILRRLHLR